MAEGLASKTEVEHHWDLLWLREANRVLDSLADARIRDAQRQTHR